MQVIRDLNGLKLNKNTVVALGKFDGVHKGHLLILNELWKYHEKGFHTAVVTFDSSFYEVLTGSRQQLLTTDEEKELILEAAGVDTILELPFSAGISKMPAADFVKDVLVGRLNMCRIVVGEDCSFGYKAAGNVALLDELSGKYGYELTVFNKIEYEGHVISSTYIREIVRDGQVSLVRRMSRQPYFVYGNVADCGGITHKYGHPYFVVNIPEEKIIPADGLYYSKVMQDEVFYPALSFVLGEKRIIETYLFEADRSLGYDNISVGLFEFVRKPFDTVDPLDLSEGELKERFKNEIINAYKWHRENIYIPEDVC